MTEPIDVRVVILNFDPIVRPGGIRPEPLHEAAGWNDPVTLAEGYRAEVETAAGGQVRFKIARWVDCDEFPHKVDGYRYSVADYEACRRTGAGWHTPDGVDYGRLIDEYGLVNMIDTGQADEVWLFGGPYFGYWESVMSGPGSFFINGGPLPEIVCRRPFVIMGFNYERTIAEMLHNLCHRIEFTLSHYSKHLPQSDWDRFSAYALQSGEPAGCGTCHFPPNSESDYDYSNRRRVRSNADDWLNYPALTGRETEVTCEAWGGPDYHRNYLKWWLKRIPRAAGVDRRSGLQNNWWKYVFQFGAFDSKGLPGRIE